MALLATVMVAVALAMRGAADANAYGRDKSRTLSQTALTLSRLSADIRRASEVTLDSSHAVTLHFPDGTQRGYSWNGTDGWPLVFTSAANPGGNILIPEVVDFTLQARNEYSDIAEAMVPVSVGVVLEVRRGQVTTRLETTVVPRRNVL